MRKEGTFNLKKEKKRKDITKTCPVTNKVGPYS